MPIATPTAAPPTQYAIPDTLRHWPWPRRVNPNYKICGAESAAWCEGLNAFNPKAQEAFNKCNFGLLGSVFYPLLDRDGCRVGCDLMNLYFVYDEYTDITDGKGVRRLSDIVMDALRNPHKPRPKGEWIGGEMTRQFWENATKVATPMAQRLFIEDFQRYTDAVVQEAEDRTGNRIRDLKSFFEVRRQTVGVKPSFAVNLLHMNLPDKVVNHPTLATLASKVIDMIVIGNDLYSYNVEQARGHHGHNLVSIVMHEYNLNLHGALDWISKLHDKVAAEFLEAYKQVPSWGEPIDSQVAEYVDGLGYWPRGNEVWSFETERYFGKKGPQVKKTRMVDLLPKKIARPADLGGAYGSYT